MATTIIIGILIIAAFIGIVTTATKIASRKESAINTSGIETDSVVVKCDHYFNRDQDSRYRCYVQYLGNDGVEHEGLLNIQTNLPVGRKVRIRYIPRQYDSVVFISQELNETAVF